MVLPRQVTSNNRLNGSRVASSEQKTRDKLAGEWSSFTATDRIKCVESIKWSEPTYSEL